MQHRKVYIDDWCLMEKICLVSAVLRLGDGNWSSVCELIKPKLQENRPWDWFTPDACEAQYQVLYNEYVKTQISDENPALQIIQNLKTRCRIECQRKEEQRNRYLALRKKIENFIKSGVENELIDKYYEDVQREKKEQEENLRRHQDALKRRETLKQEFESSNVPRTPNKQETKVEGGPSPIVTSPLLSSLLNNPPAIQYRPTLSTSSFIPTKTAQSLSKSSSFEKLPSFSSDSSPYKDSFSSELAEQQITSLDRQPVSVASSSSTIIKKSESQEPINTMPVVTGNRTPIIESSVSKILSSTTETTPKSDTQNLGNSGLISPSEEYLTDIPREAFLEVLGDLKEGTISIDKLLQDLEATDEGVIIDKDLAAVSIPVNESFIINNKPVEDTHYAPEVSSQVHLANQVESEFVNETKVEVNEIEVRHSDLSSTELDKLDNEEQVIILENVDRKEHEVHTPETEDIANIGMNNVDSSVIKDESPSSLSFSSTIAISVELDSSFSEQKSDNETAESQATKLFSNKSSESEIEDEMKSKCPSKPVVVIKRIEDGANNSNKSKKSKNTIPLEETVKEAENMSSEVDRTLDEKELSPEEVMTVPIQHPAVEENQQMLHEIQAHSPVFEENITTGKDSDAKEEKAEGRIQIVGPVETLSTADDSDVSEKFEDALQTQIEETDTAHVPENSIVVETEEKSSPYADVDESFELNVSEEKPKENLIISEKQQDDEKQLEIPVTEQISREIVSEIKNIEPNKSQLVEYSTSDIEDIMDENTKSDQNKVYEAVQEVVEESKKPEDVKPLPMKIIKSLRRKRKSNSETSDAAAEMSIVIPTVALKEIETVDSDVEQTFTPVHSIKTEPSDTKPEDGRKEKEQETPVIEKPVPKGESTPARVKSERKDTKTPEPVVMVLRRSNNKTQSPMKKMERESRSMDNSELMKTRKKSIMLAYNRLTTHKYANAFLRPITNRQAQGYENTIYKPMDLHTIKKKIDNKQISSVAEFQRDILLMLNNAKMFNRINSQVYNMAVEVEEDALPNIQYTVQNLGEGVLNKIHKSSEKIRKRQSLENTKKDLKLIKRIKYSTKDDSLTNLPVKKPKLEENEDE